MPLLAEQLVDEWLNRQGFFTLRGAKAGRTEIDLLGVRMLENRLEGWHVEVQVSFRPINYIAPLSNDEQHRLGARGPNAAVQRPPDIVEAAAKRWVEKKFGSQSCKQLRESCWKDVDWQFKFVHAKVHNRSELEDISACGVELKPFEGVLAELCRPPPGQVTTAAGTDIAEIIRYFVEHSA